MAINIPLTNGNDGPFPLPFQGEVFLLTRDRIALSFKDSFYNVGSVNGRLFMTNLRMVFLVSEKDRNKARCETFEMPFRGLWDERLNQPIFGANNLTATMQYYDGQSFTGTLSIKLIFREGGVGTFLPVFNTVLRATRVQLELESRAGANTTPIATASDTASVQDYMPNGSDAFVDPQDPSRIYTSQPAVNIGNRRDSPPGWSVSSAGLRRRSVLIV